MLDKGAKDKLIKKFQTHAGDTGSPQVQVAILTEEIRSLVEHLKGNKKDFSSRRGLLKKVSERRRLLKYLEREDAQAHDDLARKLKLKVKSAVVAAAEKVAAAAAKAAA
jgi:small subunit ribosomal protein S15